MTKFQRIGFGLVLIIITGLFPQDCDGAVRNCYRGNLRLPCCEENDATMEEDTTGGSEVVEAVLEKLNCLRVFSCDHMLMQRIAYVESEYGEIDDCSGGIWCLEENAFNILSDHQDKLQDVTELIYDRSGISFFDDVTSYNESLNTPFYSGLAARLYLHYLEKSNVKVPLNGTIEMQAEFWIEHYHNRTAATNEAFINKADSIGFDCTVNADIYFLLDSSSSITEKNFGQVRTFLLNFVNLLNIGPQDDQVGIVTFADDAQVVFRLGQYNTSSALKNAINNLPFSGGFTNLPEGLCYLRKGFTDEEHGARPASAGEVFRAAIVMSDGIPNTKEKTCRDSYTNYTEEAKLLHNLRPKVGVHVIGVTDNIKYEVLKATASNPTCEYVTHIDDFHRLHHLENWYIYDICKRASIEIGINQTLNGTLDRDENTRYQLPIPNIGITVRVCVSEGRVQVYGSVTIPNPNSALYSWMFEVKHELQETGTQTCLSYFITTITISAATGTQSGPTSSSEDTTPFESTAKSKVTPSTEATTSSEATPPTFGADALTLTDQNLYISVVGMEDHNSFVLDGTIGNNCDEANTQCVQDDPTTNSPTTTSPDNDPNTNVSVIVIVTTSGLVLVIVCILIVFLVNAYFVNRKKKSKQEDEQSLMTESIDYVSF